MANEAKTYAIFRDMLRNKGSYVDLTYSGMFNLRKEIASIYSTSFRDFYEDWCEGKYTNEEGNKMLEKYFIVRIAWVFGINGNNFIKTMLKLADKYPELKVVNDQIGSPTYTVDLAKLFY